MTGFIFRCLALLLIVLYIVPLRLSAEPIHKASPSKVEISSYLRYESQINMWLNMSANSIRMVGMRMYAPILIPRPTPPPGTFNGGLGGYIGSVPDPRSVPLKKVMSGLEGALVLYCKLKEDSGKIEKPVLLRSSGHKLNDETAIQLLRLTPKLPKPPVKLPYVRGLLVIFEPKNVIKVSIAPERIDFKDHSFLTSKEFYKMFRDKSKLASFYMERENYSSASIAISEVAALLRRYSSIDRGSLRLSNSASYIVKEVIKSGSPKELLPATQELISACENNTLLGMRTFSFGNFGYHGGNDGIYCVDYSLVGGANQNSKSLLDFIFTCKLKRQSENVLVSKVWSKSLETLDKQRSVDKTPQ